MSTGMKVSGGLKRGKRVIKALVNNQAKAKINAQIPCVPDAFGRMEEMEKQIAALKKTIAGHQVTIDKLWAWKMQQETKDASS